MNAIIVPLVMHFIGFTVVHLDDNCYIPEQQSFYSRVCTGIDRTGDYSDD